MISDIEQWMRYHAARNLTSHTYEASIAEQVYAVTSDFAADAQRLLKALEARND